MKRSLNFHANQHIKRKKEFKSLYEKSFRVHGGSFVFRFIFSETTRLGISVSKKFGNAVYRNRIKRIIRESFRHHEFPYNIDILVSQSKPLKKDPVIELKRAFKLLSDYYFLQQCTCHPAALSTSQSSLKLSFLAKILFNIILFYRKQISKNLSPACRFSPSCSVYALEALRVHPLAYAIYLIAKRLLSCHPLGKEGYDPVPKRKNKQKKQDI